MPRSTLRRLRTSLALVAVSALTLTGLVVTTTTPALAAAQPTLTISPSPAVPGTLQTFTATVEGGSSNNVARATVTLPSSFTGIGSGTILSPAGWTLSYNSGNKSFTVVNVDGPQGGEKLGSGQTSVFTFQAIPPAATGNVTFGLQTWSNRDGNGGGFTLTGGVTVPVGSLTQAIDFAPLGGKTFGDAPFTVSATGGGSGNAVTFTATGNCTSTGTNGTTITLTGAGSCSVTANQAAGNGYSAATPVTRSFDIGKSDQTITLDPISTQTFGDGPVTVVASASSGLAVSLNASGACTLTGTSLSLDAAGQCTVTADQAGNTNYNAATQQSVTFTINKAGAVLALDNLGPYTYDGNPHAASASSTPSGLSGIELTYDGSGTPPTDAGSYTVVATLTNDNYEATSVSGTLVISAKHITGTFTVDGKTYDGSTDATVSGRDLVGVVDGDDVTLEGGTATFDSKDVGTRTATLTGATLGGADAGNYVLDSVATTTAEITALEVTGEIVADDKTYDGTRDATAVGASLAGKVGSDDVSVSVTGALFDTKDVGTGKTVTASITLTGADAGNYSLSSDTATDTADIWAIQLVGSFTADNKVYDGTTAAVVHPVALVGVLAGEDVTLTATGGTFDDKNVGTGKTVTATLALAGADAGNYELVNAGPRTSTADITAKSVTGSFTAADKVWDGTNAATIVTRSLTGAIAGDDVALSGGAPATFASSSVGTWTVTGSGFTLTGADAGNYALASSTLTTTATISALYRGTGFYQPVDMTPVGGARVYNTIKGGQTVPLKFDIVNTQTGVEQTSLSIFGADATAQAAAFKVNKVTCSSSSAPDDAIELVTTGATTLRYDGTAPTGQWIQNWKTPVGAGLCYSVSVFTVDGSSVGPAYFKVTK